MINLIHNKIKSWNRESVDIFYANFPALEWRNLVAPAPLSTWHLPEDRDGMFFWMNFVYGGIAPGDEYLWEISDDYKIFYRKWGAYCFTNDGRVHRLALTTHTLPNDWNLFEELYNLSKDNRYRIDIPIHHEIVNLDGLDYDYSVIERPNKELGFDPRHMHILHLIDEEILHRYIDDATLIMNDLKYLDKKYNYGTPWQGSILVKRPIDSVGPVWIHQKDFSAPIENHVLRTFGMLQYYLYRMDNVLPEKSKLDITDYALEKWPVIIESNREIFTNYGNEFLIKHNTRPETSSC